MQNLLSFILPHVTIQRKKREENVTHIQNENKEQETKKYVLHKTNNRKKETPALQVDKFSYCRCCRRSTSISSNCSQELH